MEYDHKPDSVLLSFDLNGDRNRLYPSQHKMPHCVGQYDKETAGLREIIATYNGDGVRLDFVVANDN